MELLLRYIKAKKRLDECRDSCEYDAGYYCSDYAEEVHQIEREYESELEKKVLNILAKYKVIIVK